MDMEILELLDYVNKGLEDNKSVRSISDELGLDESSIRKRLNKYGYKRIENKFVKEEEIKHNITLVNKCEYEQLIMPGVIEEKPVKMMCSEVEMAKLHTLLDNLDELLKLIPKENTINIRLKCDSELYGDIKEVSKRDNISIQDIVNKALVDYLKNNK